MNFGEIFFSSFPPPLPSFPCFSFLRVSFIGSDGCIC